MTLVSLILLALKLSIGLQMFAQGLQAQPRDVLYLSRHPSQLLRSLLSINIIMPIVAAAAAAFLALSTPVKIMLVCVALSPVPPLLLGKQIKAGGHGAYGVSLLVAAALVAIVSAPLLLEAFERAFNVPLRMSMAEVARIMLLTILLPLGLGVAARALAPKLAERLAPTLGAIAGAVLAVSAIAIIAGSWRAIVAQIGHGGSVIAIVGFAIIGLAVGHFLGGPDPADRTVLSLATASRHPGLAAAIAGANFPEHHAALALLLLYLVLSGVVTALYLRWRKAREHSGLPHARTR